MNIRQWTACLMTATMMTTISAQDTSERPQLVLPERLWGWADLHAHPASHLAFGNDAEGHGGIFWGHPGLDLKNGEKDIDLELPKCSYKHGGTDGDLIRHETHKGLMAQLDAVANYPHQTADFGDNNEGNPGFKHWPNARSITHQQMHITQIRRAYDGGQRLMIASTTDNELLASLWTKIGHNVGGNPVPAIEDSFGHDSAARQIRFIKEMAKTNKDWMEIAYSAADARRIIKADKLALILSVEMDRLGTGAIMDLVLGHGVRHVIPVHLVDNDFGGTAVYSNVFNALNNFYHSTRKNNGDLNNDGFYKIVIDKNIKFELGRPSYLRPEGFNWVKGGAIHIDPVPQNIWNQLRHNAQGNGYEDGGGHRNRLGLTTGGVQLLRWLAANGVMIDVAHMSQRAVAATFQNVIPWNYPVMDSHTGIREEGGTGESERHLHPAHVETIGKLGGVIGHGTEWTGGMIDALSLWNMQVHMGRTGGINYGNQNPNHKDFTMHHIQGEPEIAHIQFTIKTGGDSLTTDLNAIFRIKGKEYRYLLNKFHEGWRGGLVTTPIVTLPRGTTSDDIQHFALEVGQGAWWSLDEIRVQLVPRKEGPVKTWLDSYKRALELMNGKGVALGTDINGFAPQLWLGEEAIDYPVNVARRFGLPKRPLLSQDRLGDRTFNFKTDGIAHYGMLPDFLQALSEQPESNDAVHAMFRTADDVVSMWEKCERQKSAVK